LDETGEDGEFRVLCHEAGLADTPQRRVIYRTLRESHDHPTAETLHDRVRRTLPGVSLATVYRNLRHFAEAGIVEEVATGSSFARYDANRDRHHHLICRACGAVVDYYSSEFDSIASARVELEGFQVQDATVNVYGLCSQCAGAREQGP
jgi:Fur family peroxide stress response transcriptional regulator